MFRNRLEGIQMTDLCMVRAGRGTIHKESLIIVEVVIY